MTDIKVYENKFLLLSKNIYIMLFLYTTLPNNGEFNFILPKYNLYLLNDISTKRTYIF